MDPAANAHPASQPTGFVELLTGVMKFVLPETFRQSNSVGTGPRRVPLVTPAIEKATATTITIIILQFSKRAHVGLEYMQISS
eukprot:m.172358 g.172358  ORF g.172358 m.172358 type:complete len:83 (+) comp31682_c0_seq2:1832-2080(+)